MTTTNPPIRTRRRLALALGGLALAALPILAACGDDEKAADDTTSTTLTADQQLDAELTAFNDTPAVSYVGKIDGTDAYIAVVNRDGDVEVYLCDNDGLARWFAGELEDGALSGEAPDGSTVAGTAKDGTITGSVTLAEGKTYDFSATKADLPAGLWQTQRTVGTTVDDVVRIGWVVLPDATQRGAKSANIAGEVPPVNTLNGTADLEGDGQPSTVLPPGPVPGKDGTGGSPGLCQQAQDSFNINNQALKDENNNANTRKSAKRIMANAKAIWASDCQGTYGNIGDAVIPPEA